MSFWENFYSNFLNSIFQPVENQSSQLLMQLSPFLFEDGKILLKTQTNGPDLRQIWHKKCEKEEQQVEN